MKKKILLLSVAVLFTCHMFLAMQKNQQSKKSPANTAIKIGNLYIGEITFQKDNKYTVMIRMGNRILQNHIIRCDITKKKKIAIPRGNLIGKTVIIKLGGVTRIAFGSSGNNGDDRYYYNGTILEFPDYKPTENIKLKTGNLYIGTITKYKESPNYEVKIRIGGRTLPNYVVTCTKAKKVQPFGGKTVIIQLGETTGEKFDSSGNRGNDRYYYNGTILEEMPKSKNKRFYYPAYEDVNDNRIINIGDGYRGTITKVVREKKEEEEIEKKEKQSIFSFAYWTNGEKSDNNNEYDEYDKLYKRYWVTVRMGPSRIEQNRLMSPEHQVFCIIKDRFLEIPQGNLLGRKVMITLKRKKEVSLGGTPSEHYTGTIVKFFK